MFVYPPSRSIIHLRVCLRYIRFTNDIDAPPLSNNYHQHAFSGWDIGLADGKFLTNGPSQSSLTPNCTLYTFPNTFRIFSSSPVCFPLHVEAKHDTIQRFSALGM